MSVHLRSGTYRSRLLFSIETLLAWPVSNSIAHAVVPKNKPNDSVLQITSKSSMKNKHTECVDFCISCSLEVTFVLLI